MQFKHENTAGNMQNASDQREQSLKGRSGACLTLTLKPKYKFAPDLLSLPIFSFTRTPRIRRFQFNRCVIPPTHPPTHIMLSPPPTSLQAEGYISSAVPAA